LAEDPHDPKDPLPDLDAPQPLEGFSRRLYLLRRKFGRNAPILFGLSGGAARLLSFKAGREITGTPGRERPLYPDVFGTGACVSVHAAFTFKPALSLLLRGGMELYPGRRRSEGILGRVRYTDMRIYPVLAGIRLSAPFGLPVSAWGVQDFSPKVKGGGPFFEVLAGMAYRSRVDLKPQSAYWGGATVFSSALGLGVEYRFGTLALFASLRVAYHSEPPDRVWYAEPEAALAAGLSGGFSLRI
jgi:hypothetical protein